MVHDPGGPGATFRWPSSVWIQRNKGAKVELPSKGSQCFSTRANLKPKGDTFRLTLFLNVVGDVGDVVYFKHTSGRLYSYSKIFWGKSRYVRETMCLKGMLVPVFWGCCRESGHPLLICSSLTTAQSNSYLFARCLNNLRTLCLSWPTCILAEKPSQCPPKFYCGQTPSLIYPERWFSKANPS